MGSDGDSVSQCSHTLNFTPEAALTTFCLGIYVKVLLFFTPSCGLFCACDRQGDPILCIYSSMEGTKMEEVHLSGEGRGREGEGGGGVV